MIPVYPVMLATALVLILDGVFDLYGVLGGIVLLLADGFRDRYTEPVRI